MPGESHGQRSLAGYSPLGHKESDTTERLHFHFLKDKVTKFREVKVVTCTKCTSIKRKSWDLNWGLSDVEAQCLEQFPKGSGGGAEVFQRQSLGREAGEAFLHYN